MSDPQAGFEPTSNGSGEAIIGTLDGAPLRANFPLYVTVFGIEAVVIPAGEYRQLVGARLKLPFVEVRAATRAVASTPRRRLSTVERDPEVAAFLRQRFAVADTIEAALAACRERFGADRTPSRSRASRFRARG